MAGEDDFEIVDGLAEHREQHGVGFWDLARIRKTPETEAAGYAALEGLVMGETMPSTGAIEGETLVGEPSDDFALYVDFGDRGGAWFAAHLVEFAGRPESVEFEVGDVRAVRDETGNWREFRRDEAGEWRELPPEDD